MLATWDWWMPLRPVGYLRPSEKAARVSHGAVRLSQAIMLFDEKS